MKDVIALSRNAAAQVSSVKGNSKGTGFLIGRKHVATCFHVVARVSQSGNQIVWDIFQDLKVKLSNGVEVAAKVVSVPSQQSADPLLHDFAVLELQEEVPQELSSVMEVVSPMFDVGDDVVFSGYPLATPAMVTHKGMISGYDLKSAIICVQGSINKGNSGGALCNASGHVIGLLSMREGGIGKGLSELNTNIEEGSKRARVELIGVNPLEAIRAISETLDRYISTGIGYARSSAHLKAYLDAHPDLKE